MKNSVIKIGKNKPFTLEVDEYRTGVIGAKMILSFELVWFAFPSTAWVELDGVRYYFRITYRPYYPNKKAEQNRTPSSMTPTIEFTCKRGVKV